MKLYLFILILFTGCSSLPKTPITAKEPKNIFVTPAGTEKLFPDAVVRESYVITPKRVLGAGEQEAFIDPAVKAWNEAMGFELIRTSGEGFPITAVYVQELPNGDTRASAQAYRKKDSCDVFVKHEWIARGLDVNMLIHEIGHCVGFDHASWDASVMWWEVNWDQRITSEMRRMILEALEAEETR